MTNDDQAECPYCEQSTSGLASDPGARHLEEHRRAATDALLAAGWTPPESAGDGGLVPPAVLHGFHRMLHEMKELIQPSESEIARQMQADEALKSNRAEARKLALETQMGSPNEGGSIYPYR